MSPYSENKKLKQPRNHREGVSANPGVLREPKREPWQNHRKLSRKLETPPPSSDIPPLKNGKGHHRFFGKHFWSKKNRLWSEKATPRVIYGKFGGYLNYWGPKKVGRPLNICTTFRRFFLNHGTHSSSVIPLMEATPNCTSMKLAKYLDPPKGAKQTPVGLQHHWLEGAGSLYFNLSLSLFTHF